MDTLRKALADDLGSQRDEDPVAFWVLVVWCVLGAVVVFVVLGAVLFGELLPTLGH
jgi:hypothetical protein